MAGGRSTRTTSAAAQDRDPLGPIAEGDENADPNASTEVHSKQAGASEGGPPDPPHPPQGVNAELLAAMQSFIEKKTHETMEQLGLNRLNNTIYAPKVRRGRTKHDAAAVTETRSPD